MRQYTNRAQSGTVTQTKRRPDKMDPVIDRVMLIAERLVNAEKQLTALGNTVKGVLDVQKQQQDNLEQLLNKIDNIKLRSEGKEFKKPTPTRSKTTKTTPTTTTES